MDPESCVAPSPLMSLLRHALIDELAWNDRGQDFTNET